MDHHNLKTPYLPKVKKWISLLICLGFWSLCLPWTSAQTIVQPKQLDYSSMGILYNEERALELRPHTNGGALGFQFGKILTYYKTRYSQFEIGFLKHPKEYRQSISFHT